MQQLQVQLLKQLKVVIMAVEMALITLEVQEDMQVEAVVLLT